MLILAGLWAFAEFYFSDPIVAHGDLEPDAPLSLPFEISNLHYFPLLITERTCIVDSVHETHSDLNQQLVDFDPAPRIVMKYRDHVPYVCPFSPEGNFKELAVRVIVRYRALWILPQQMSHADFRVIRGPNNALHWTEGLDPNGPVRHEFVEYPPPRSPNTVIWYCDLDGPGTAECKFTSPASEHWEMIIPPMRINCGKITRLITGFTKTHPQVQ